jgi:hypothetical protein
MLNNVTPSQLEFIDVLFLKTVSLFVAAEARDRRTARNVSDDDVPAALRDSILLFKGATPAATKLRLPAQLRTNKR